MLNNDDSPFLLLVAVPTQGQLRQCHFHAGKESGQESTYVGQMNKENEMSGELLPIPEK